RCRIKIWIVGDLPLIVSLYEQAQTKVDKLPRLQHTKETTKRLPRPPLADPDVADGGAAS
ncbi:hypothetical protein JMJ77_0006957, partial [Colletotrichum scovillei]